MIVMDDDGNKHTDEWVKEEKRTNTSLKNPSYNKGGKAGYEA